MKEECKAFAKCDRCGIVFCNKHLKEKDEKLYCSLCIYSIEKNVGDQETQELINDKIRYEINTGDCDPQSEDSRE